MSPCVANSFIWSQFFPGTNGASPVLGLRDPICVPPFVSWRHRRLRYAKAARMDPGRGAPRVAWSWCVQSFVSWSFHSLLFPGTPYCVSIFNKRYTYVPYAPPEKCPRAVDNVFTNDRVRAYFRARVFHSIPFHAPLPPPRPCCRTCWPSSCGPRSCCSLAWSRRGRSTSGTGEWLAAQQPRLIVCCLSVLYVLTCRSLLNPFHPCLL